jgi:hypothetical protein
LAVFLWFPVIKYLVRIKNNKKGVFFLAAKEAKARIKINKLLEEAGWRLIDDSEIECGKEWGLSCIGFRNNNKIITPRRGRK